MTAVFQSETGASLTNSTFTPTKPSGTTSGDLLILHIGHEKGSDITVTTIPQWTLIRTEVNSTNVSCRTYRRAEEGSALTAITLSASVKLTWTVARFDGHDAATPIDGVNGANGASGNPDPPSQTPTVSDCLALVVCSNKNAPTGTAPSGYTERWDRANTADGIGWTYGCTKTLPTTSAEDPAVVTASVTAEWAAQTILIKPAAAPAASSYSWWGSGVGGW
jgi:hypothetical protein